MAFIEMNNYAGQILAGMNIEAPVGAKVYDADSGQPITVDVKTQYKALGNNRLGIARYRINLSDSANKRFYSLNYQMSGEGWTLLDPPYTPAQIKEIYGYDVGPDGKRLKKYKLTGRRRTQKLARELKGLGRHLDAERIIQEMEVSLAQGKRYIIRRQDIGL